MGFYLTYVDDYGNSGSNLEDPQQPLFMLFALTIPAERWHELEAALWLIIKGVAKKCDLHLTDFELHAKEFFSPRHPSFLNLDMEARAEVAIELAHAIKRFDGRYTAIYVVKSDVAAKIHLLKSVNSEYIRKQAIPHEDMGVLERAGHKFTEGLLHPYVQCLAALTVELDDALYGLRDSGALIVDRQDQFRMQHTIKAFTLLRGRAKGQIRALIEQPLRGEGKYNLMLQAADMIGYLVGSGLKHRVLGLPLRAHYQTILDLITPSLTAKDASVLTDDNRCRVIASEFASQLAKTPYPPELVEDLIDWYTQAEDDNKKDEEIPDGLEP